MSRPARLVVLVALVVGVVMVATYLSGRATCPPPDWWLTIFTRDDNFGCVA